MDFQKFKCAKRCIITSKLVGVCVPCAQYCSMDQLAAHKGGPCKLLFHSGNGYYEYAENSEILGSFVRKHGRDVIVHDLTGEMNLAHPFQKRLSQNKILLLLRPLSSYLFHVSDLPPPVSANSIVSDL